MIVVIGVPCRDVVAQALAVPGVGVTLAVAETGTALVLALVATVRAPGAELSTRDGVDAAKAVRLAVGAADADAVLERVGNVLRGCGA